MNMGYKKEEVDAVRRLLSDGKPRTTFEIAEDLKPLSTDLDAQHVYCILLFPLMGEVNSHRGRFTLRDPRK
jgi:hypothetical protein